MGYIYPKVLVPVCSLENGLSNGTSSITVRLSEAKLLNVRHSTRPARHSTRKPCDEAPLDQ